tara:strand:- start:4669 stop:5247 length:579 start_codon:yes stop_codon:yes gene_type:complete
MTQEDYIKYEMQKGGNLEEYKDIKILTSENKIAGELRPCLKVWVGKQKNPKMNYYFRSEERRNQAIKSAKDGADTRQEYKQKRKAERKAFKPDIKIGDIYYSSWGYEQTNIDFYQVIEIKGKATVVLKEIAQDTVEGSNYSHGMACEVIAVKDKFLNDKTITKRVSQYGISLTSYSSARKWDGKPQYKSWYA